MTENQTSIIVQLENIQPKERILYHFGQHLNEAPLIQKAAYRLYQEGRVFLFQKRVGDQFEYWAVGCSTER